MDLADKHIIKAWTFQDVLLESYRYAPGPAETLPAHSHDEYQLGISINFPGEYTYRGTRYPVPVGSFNVIHPGEMHSARDTEYRHVYADFRKVYIAPERVRSLAAEVTARESNLPFFAEPIILDSDLAKLFLDFHNASAEAKPRLEQEALLLLLMAKLITSYADDQHQPRPLGAERDGIRRVREYLQDNYAENVSLERLAAIAGLSRFHLLRAFRQEVGLPPHRYQLQVRIERAKHLRAGGMPIHEVALAVGFVDQSHFTRHFRKLAQVTPGRYGPGR